MDYKVQYIIDLSAIPIFLYKYLSNTSIRNCSSKLILDIEALQPDYDKNKINQ